MALRDSRYIRDVLRILFAGKNNPKHGRLTTGKLSTRDELDSSMAQSNHFDY